MDIGGENMMWRDPARSKALALYLYFINSDRPARWGTGLSKFIKKCEGLALAY